ncbi:MAG: peptide-binding protein [Humidesulfovibrio sp.]|uniref:peptide-binding protein n=1 Tax=Humidesulfovibrio sp. TaxID=2910988 RepID=UPI0027336494|nr:peptide-binding protein [Humidesulfovibrio sp.]MDP2848169.1 peptide-binding protein [Humidesulfovibrio sp.]
MKRSALHLALCALLFLAACGRGEAPRTQAGEAAPQDVPAAPEVGGRLVEATIGEPSNLIPPLATDSASHEVSELVYVAPLKYDKNINLVPHAAESFEILDDGRLLRFTLRKGIRWTDGTPLTAHDVEFTYKLMVDPKTPTAYAEDFLAVKEFRLTGDYTFEVRYDKPFARALVTWAHAILPRHLLEGQDLLKTPLARKPVGAGPYMLKEWTAGNRLVLVANPDYFEGRAYIDEVVMRIIPDQSTQFMELKSGNLDQINLSPQQYLYQTEGQDWAKDYRKFQYVSSGYTFMAYNLKSPLFSDVRVRRAFLYAIDKDEIVRGVLAGLGIATGGPYKPGTWAFNDKIPANEFDPARARQLLAEAGWTRRTPDGPLVDARGRPFAFTILTNQGNTPRIKSAIIIQSRLAGLGIKVEIRTVEWAAFVKEFVDKGRYDAIILGWNIVQDPDLYDVWHSSKAHPGGLNFVGYKNRELDELLERARRMLDQKKRKPLYDRLQEILHEDQPYCFLYVPMALPMVHARVQGIEPAPAGISYNFIRWWIPKASQGPELTQ